MVNENNVPILIGEVFGVPPIDEFQEEVEEKQIDNSDFDPDPNPELEEQEVDPGPGEEVEIDPDEDAIEVDAIEEDNTEEAERKKLDKEGEDFRKDLLRLIKPSTIIKFVDKMIAKTGSMILIRSEQKDWKLDSEEMELLGDILDAMIEEENIELWDAKVWLILAVVVIYGMKGADIYTQYYSGEGALKHEPIMQLESIKAEQIQHTAKLDALLIEAEMLEKEAKIKARIYQAKTAIENNVTPVAAEKIIAHEQLENIAYNGQDMNPKKSKKGHFTINEMGHVFDHSDYDPKIWSYENGLLRLKTDGTPAKIRGKQYRNKTTGKLISKNDYFELYPEEKDITDVEIIEQND